MRRAYLRRRHGALPVRKAVGLRPLHAPRRCRHQSLSYQLRRERGVGHTAEPAHGAPMKPASPVSAIRGALVTFSGDPFVEGVADTRRYVRDAIVAMADGCIVDCGEARDVLPRLPADTRVV